MTARLRNCAAFAGIAVLMWIFVIGNFNGVSKAIAVIVSLPLALMAFTFIYKLICKYDNKLKKNARLFSFIALSVMFVLLLICGFMNRQNPVHTPKPSLPDVSIAIRGAQHLAAGEALSNVEYFSRYPNTHALLFFFTGIGKVLLFITGSVEHLYSVAIVINAVLITLTVLLVMKCSAMLSGTRAAAFSFVLCFFFSPLYLVMPLTYTDTIAMTAMAGTLYFFIRFIRKQKLYNLALSGILCALGTLFKPTVAIFVIAAVIILLLSKHSVLKRVITLLLAFAIVFTGFTIPINNSGLISDELYDTYKYPPQHWVMMSLSGSGGFNNEAASFTTNAGNYEQKQENINNEIIRIVKEKGVFGTVYHLLFTKVAAMWDSGTLGLYSRIQDCQSDNPIQWAITTPLPSSLIAAVSQGIYASILLLSLMGAIKKRKNILFQTLLLALFGAFVFFMLWEAEGRYMLQFMPIFFVLVAVGAKPTFERIAALKTKLNIAKAVNK